MNATKLALKVYNTRDDWVGKVIHWEMCKKFKSDHMNKWYMHNPASVLENNTHKLLWDFDIQTDHLISARRPDLLIINNKKKENMQNCRLRCPGWPQNKTEGKWKEGISTWALLRNWKNYGTWRWQLCQRIIKGIGGLEGRRTSGDYPNYNTIENGQNTEKSPENLKRLTVTQTPVKNHQLKLMWKTLKE